VELASGNNNRQTGIDDYLLMIKNVREMFPGSRGPWLRAAAHVTNAA
jgi:hypothetical protein